MDEPLPVVVVGAGAMGREWIRLLRDSEVARIVGIVDLDVPLAREAARTLAPDAPAGSNLPQILDDSGARAVIDVTVPAAHRAVNEQAMRSGVPVLCEKPLAPTLSAALRQVALADVTGRLLMVSQSRRYFNRLAALRRAVRRAGPIGVVTQEFFHADHEPGFREQMDHPLLVDMSIHHFDALRYVTGDEPASVSCVTWNPGWSWFRGDACASAEFALRSGARFTYVGSRCTPGLQTSWNATWRVHSASGAIGWDGDTRLSVELEGSGAPEVASAPEGLAGSLADFVHAIRNGLTPQNEVRDNILSLAMVEGAVSSSAQRGRRVIIADLLDQAYRRALDEETADDVRAELERWTDPQKAIETGHWGSCEPATVDEKEHP